MSSNDYNDGGWEPVTRLGKKVQEGEIDTMEDALNSGLPLKEPEVTDQLLPGLEDEVLDINMVQRMTDSGRRVKFRCVVAIGNRDGFVGYAEGRDDQVGAAIQKAIGIAKLNIINVSRGCGSWECGCGRPHTVALRSSGKAGSVEVELQPAPRGLGLAGGETVRNVLELAGIEDAWTRSSGNTRTTVNFAKATFNALRNTAEARVPQHAFEQREVIE
ncbi:30S ribosomal protein S5 [Halostella salina]|uniref:30S ribosomal protein S5 n=1 Tax=Halostella salina TaxID=1547897 RepID=UPI000EF7F10A|nr:30S ribosomal protein S5 [Halostella salina]